MAEMWKPKDPKLLRSWLDAIIDEASDELNDWEKNFIDNMERTMNEGWTLSRSQEEKLEQIYARKTS